MHDEPPGIANKIRLVVDDILSFPRDCLFVLSKCTYILWREKCFSFLSDIIQCFKTAVFATETRRKEKQKQYGTSTEPNNKICDVD